MSCDVVFGKAEGHSTAWLLVDLHCGVAGCTLPTSKANKGAAFQAWPGHQLSVLHAAAPDILSALPATIFALVNTMHCSLQLLYAAIQLLV